MLRKKKWFAITCSYIFIVIFVLRLPEAKSDDVEADGEDKAVPMPTPLSS
jgi:hypothetical protein